MKEIHCTHKKYGIDFYAFLYSNRRSMRRGVDNQYPCGKDVRIGRGTEALMHICDCKDKVGIGLFFHKEKITPGIIAHEVQHMMNRVISGSHFKKRYTIKIHDKNHEESICADYEQIIDLIWDEFKDEV